MIIDNTYFKGEIYIPHAKPSVNDAVTGVEQDIISFINEYANDCLVKCLGQELRDELVDNLDETSLTWVDALANVKWDYLVNGLTYVDPNTGVQVKWRGLRFKSNVFGNGEYDKSLLAYYTYFYYEKDDYITRATLGSFVEESTAGAVAVPPNDKAVNAWNKFVDLAQGKDSYKVIKQTTLGPAIDYSGQSREVSLYKFIEDQNTIAANTYANFDPKVWTKMNLFNL